MGSAPYANTKLANSQVAQERPTVIALALSVAHAFAWHLEHDPFKHGQRLRSD